MATVRQTPTAQDRYRTALLYLLRRIRGGRRVEPGPVLDLVVEGSPAPPPPAMPWRFWLWLIDERPLTLLRPDRTPRGDSIQRLRIYLDPPGERSDTDPPPPEGSRSVS